MRYKTIKDQITSVGKRYTAAAHGIRLQACFTYSRGRRKGNVVGCVIHVRYKIRGCLSKVLQVSATRAA